MPQQSLGLLEPQLEQVPAHPLPPADWYPRALHTGGGGGGGFGARPGGKGGGGGMSSMSTEMRTHTSDLKVWYLCQVMGPVQLAVQPTAAEKDVPPTTRPESGELQSFCSLKYMPMRALP